MAEPGAPPGGRRLVVTSAHAGRRLDAFLAGPDRLGPRARVTRALERGQVFVNDREATPADAARIVAIGDQVALWLDRPGSARRRTRSAASAAARLPILFEDDRLIVVNKPSGLLTVALPGRGQLPSVAEHLRAHLRSRGKRRPLVVHRIDRDTSGLVVFATLAHAQQVLKDQFRRHEPERVYLAVVNGIPTPDKGSWRDRLLWDQARLVQTPTHPHDPRGHEGLCHYRVLETFDDASLIEVRLVTGMRNQIRLQARLHGHTLIGEQQYAAETDPLPGVTFSRQALHAAKLSFKHPRTGRLVTFEAPLPVDMSELLTVLRKRQACAAGHRQPDAAAQARRQIPTSR